jgi:hypothetical protein
MRSDSLNMDFENSSNLMHKDSIDLNDMSLMRELSNNFESFGYTNLSSKIKIFVLLLILFWRCYYSSIFIKADYKNIINNKCI